VSVVNPDCLPENDASVHTPVAGGDGVVFRIPLRLDDAGPGATRAMALETTGPVAALGAADPLLGRALVSSTGRKPRILVLLACFNGAKWIGEQLESVLAQHDVDLRVIIRDDGSSDATMTEIDRFHGDGRVKSYAGRPPTGSAAQNFLALIRDNPADGFDFVAFADQDDAWNPNKLATACRMLTSSRHAAGYSSSTVATWPNGRRALFTQSARVSSVDFLFEGGGQGCTYVLRSRFYARIHAFAIRHRQLTEQVGYHDWMVYALARSWGSSWLFDASPSMCYRQHATNDTGARSASAGVRKRFDRLRRGWYCNQLRVIASICATAAPGNPTIERWTKTLFAAKDRHRNLQIALYCLQGARRRRLDNLIIAAAALVGWL